MRALSCVTAAAMLLASVPAQAACDANNTYSFAFASVADASLTYGNTYTYTATNPLGATRSLHLPRRQQRPELDPGERRQHAADQQRPDQRHRRQDLPDRRHLPVAHREHHLEHPDHPADHRLRGRRCATSSSTATMSTSRATSSATGCMSPAATAPRPSCRRFPPRPGTTTAPARARRRARRSISAPTTRPSS